MLNFLPLICIYAPYNRVKSKFVYYIYLRVQKKIKIHTSSINNQSTTRQIINELLKILPLICTYLFLCYCLLFV